MWVGGWGVLPNRSEGTVFSPVRCYNTRMIVSLERGQLSGLTLPLHHAYCVIGEAEQTLSAIKDFFEREFDFEARDNPDFLLEQYEVMGIDEARALKEAAARKAVFGGKKVFIISARGITGEAQNALLKLLEEPSAEMHLFLIVSSPAILLSTVRSRLSLIHTDVGLPPVCVERTGR